MTISIMLTLAIVALIVPMNMALDRGKEGLVDVVIGIQFLLILFAMIAVATGN